MSDPGSVKPEDWDEEVCSVGVVCVVSAEVVV